MSWLDGLRYRARTLLHPLDHARESEEEAAWHVELDTLQQRDASTARRRFGNRTYHVEERRRAAGLAMFDTIAQDTRYAWRSLRRSPGFTVAVIVTLALGIGINAATFSMLDALFLRTPSGVKRAHELRRVWIEYPGPAGTFQSQVMSYHWYRGIAAAVGDTTRAALYFAEDEMHLGRGRSGPLVHVVYATANLFPVVGVRAALGRLYSPGEDVLGSPVNVAVVSDHFWRTHLGAKPSALGDTVRIQTRTYTVIGVLPREFAGLSTQAADVFIPFAATPPPPWVRNPRWWDAEYMYGYRAVVRMPDSLDDSQLATRATESIRRLSRARKDPPPGADTLARVTLGSIIEARGPAAPEQDQIIVTRLGGVAIIVLIIACANVLNLLLARMVRRRREVAVRLALGISRLRLARLLGVKTLLLALVASGVALLIGWWSGTILRRLLLPQVEWYDSVLTSRLALFAVAVGVLCGIIAGIVAALQASHPALTPALKDGARETSGRSSVRLRGALLVVQAALSIVLLAGALLFTRSLRNVTRLDIGFDRDRLVFGSMEFDDEGAPPDAVQAAGLERVAAQIRGRAEVESISLAGITPMRGFSFSTLLTSTDSVRGGSSYPSYNAVTPNFFETAGLRLLRGRTFEEHEPEIVVNEAAAASLWKGRDAIGECLYIGSRAGGCYRVTGVVENARRDQVIEPEAAPMFYMSMTVPDTARRWKPQVIVVRARAGAQASVASVLRRSLAREFPQGYPSVKSMAEQLDTQYRPWRLGAQLFGAVSVLALVVALVGIYSTVSYGVSQRTQEFGVRVALGAQIRDVLAQVLGEGLRVVTIGVIVGVLLTLAAGRLVAALLYGVAPSDPVTLTVVGLALLATAALAALVPAWRAATVDPVTALRAD